MVRKFSLTEVNILPEPLPQPVCSIQLLRIVENQNQLGDSMYDWRDTFHPLMSANVCCDAVALKMAEVI